MQPTCCAQPPRTPVGYLSVSLSLDATSSKAACRSAILRMDVSRSVWRVCLTVASSSTYFSWRRDHSHASLGQEPQPPTRAPGKRQTRAQPRVHRAPISMVGTPLWGWAYQTLR